MIFRIADTFTGSLARLTGDAQKAVPASNRLARALRRRRPAWRTRFSTSGCADVRIAFA